MFNHYRFISPEHYVALESACRAHAQQPAVLAGLYEMASKTITNGKYTVAEVPSTMMLSLMQQGNDILVVTATDRKTGNYIQLAKVPNQPRPLLTVGQKWAAESVNPQMGNVGTQIW